MNIRCWAATFCLLLLVGSFAVGAPKLALADELCAAVYPCDPRGELLPQYSNPDSGCFAVYREQCEQERALIFFQDQCTSDLETLSKQNQALRKRVKRLQLRARKRS